MSAAVFFRKVADFLEAHPGETEPFRVSADSADDVSFHGGDTTVAQVEDLVTALGGVWAAPGNLGLLGWIISEDTKVGESTIFADADVLTEVFEGLPKAWVAA